MSPVHNGICKPQLSLCQPQLTLRWEADDQQGKVGADATPRERLGVSMSSVAEPPSA